jgi:hypothetical protein
MLELFFRSGAEVKVLGVVLFSDGLHLREIARQAGVSPYEAKRELDLLVRTGVLIREEKGRQVFFRSDQSCPFLPELKGLYQKTEGIVRELKAFLSGEGVRYAFIFGSYAGGRQKRHSDIDVLIVGEAAEEGISTGIFGIQKKTGREINFIVWSYAELLKAMHSRSPFLKTVLAGETLWLVGDRDEFGRLAKEGHHPEG